MKIKCSECDEFLTTYIEGGKTLLGGIIFEQGKPCAPKHEINCVSRIYKCSNGHTRKLSIRNKCDECDWLQDPECFCHPDPKIDEWPENSVFVSERPKREYDDSRLVYKL